MPTFEALRQSCYIAKSRLLFVLWMALSGSIGWFFYANNNAVDYRMDSSTCDSWCGGLVLLLRLLYVPSWISLIMCFTTLIYFKPRQSTLKPKPAAASCADPQPLCVNPDPLCVNPLPLCVKPDPPRTVVFRYVTRGFSHNPIARSVNHTLQQLQEVSMEPNHRYPVRLCVEVITDRPVPEVDWKRIDDEHVWDFSAHPPVFQTVVPSDYKLISPIDNTETKFKARALHYAIEEGVGRYTGPETVIVHMDEETILCTDTVTQILEGVMRQSDTNYIAQGVIYYEPHLQGQPYRGIQHFVTTLADSIRVYDDWGRFGWQFTRNQCWFGMKGSFVVTTQVVEEQVSFNFGATGSITEDAYFAFRAKERGVRFWFVEGVMYELSTFTFGDFIRQRSRWMNGLQRIVRSPTIKVRTKWVLGLMLFCWGFGIFSIITVLFSLFVRYHNYRLLEVFLMVAFGIYTYMYLFGLLIQHGDLPLMKTICLLLLIFPFCVIPLLEVSAVVYCIGTNLCTKSSDQFHVVNKDIK